MNVEPRPLAVYPTFNDTQQQKLTQKELDIDESIYHLLSMYLDTNVNIIIPPSQPPQNNRAMMKHSPYFRTKRNTSSKPLHHQNWLGERKRSPTTTCTELERNTMKNSHSIPVENDTNVQIKSNKNKKARPKFVSFNETVTVINEHKKISFSNLIQPAVASPHSSDDDDDALFVDALDNFME
ncbi:hypothetical protein BD408DRAFT_412752 [Parasitella parasitica]|nr:hypothetical protein BD408DRAFT_412752 [Parasitella parasitica]